MPTIINRSLFAKLHTVIFDPSIHIEPDPEFGMPVSTKQNIFSLRSAFYLNLLESGTQAGFYLLG